MDTKEWILEENHWYDYLVENGSTSATGSQSFLTWWTVFYQGRANLEVTLSPMNNYYYNPATVTSDNFIVLLRTTDAKGEDIQVNTLVLDKRGCEKFRLLKEGKSGQWSVR